MNLFFNFFNFFKNINQFQLIGSESESVKKWVQIIGIGNRQKNDNRLCPNI